MLDFRINTFLEVCKYMNYTKAAEELHVTQPAVSQHIKYLEKNYGVKLFEYCDKKLKLTNAGECLKKVSLKMFNDEKNLKRKLKESMENKSTISFGVTKTIGEYVIAKPLSAYIKKHPEQEIKMEIANTNQLVKKMKEGKLQFALVEGFFDKNEFDSKIYASEKFVLVCHTNHTFNNKQNRNKQNRNDANEYNLEAKTPNRLKDLLNETLILREKGSGTREILTKQLEAVNIGVNDFEKTIEISGMHTILQMLEEDAGISFMFQKAADEKIKKGVLREVDIKDFQIEHDFAFIWPKGDAFSEEYVKFIEEL